MKQVPIKGYEGVYDITDDGRIWVYGVEWKSGLNGKITKKKKEGWLNEHIVRGYVQAKLRKNGVAAFRKVHRLVGEAFIPNPDNLPQINHLNGIKTDNRVANLEWCTAKQNTNHADRNGLRRVRVGTERYNTKLNENKVREIRMLVESGKLQKEVAKKYGVSASVVCSIMNRWHWKHVA